MTQSGIDVEQIMADIKQAVAAARKQMEQVPRPGPPAVGLASGNPQSYELKQILLSNNLKWDVQPERPITSHRPTIGRFLIAGKKMVRKMLRWYMDPPWEQQREFNAGINRAAVMINDMLQAFEARSDERATRGEVQSGEQERALAALRGELGAGQEKNQRLEQALTLMEERLRRMEIRTQNQAVPIQVETALGPLPVQSIPAGNTRLDYYLFEHKFRGPREEVKARQKAYREYFAGRSKVLDIGCGRGEFLELMAEDGIDTFGIDLDPDMVAECRARGLQAEQADALTYLASLPDRSLGGIFSAQVVEHLPSDQVLELISLAYAKLDTQGVLLIETINPQVLYVFANQFYLDPSHRLPVHPRALEFIFQQMGFKDITFRYSSPVEAMWIPHLDLEPSLKSNLTEFNRAVDRLNQLLFGEQDYAIIGYK